MITTTVISTTTSLSTRKAAHYNEQQELRMTSLDIAELCGKQHRHVMEAIRKMEPAWVKVHGSKFRLMFRTIVQPNGGTREVPCYQLTKTECLYIATRVTRIEWYLFLFSFFLQKIANGKWYMKKKS